MARSCFRQAAGRWGPFVLCLLFATAWAQADNADTLSTPEPADEPVQQTPRRGPGGPAEINRLVAELNREAADFARHHQWHRSRQDFITKYSDELDRTALLDALARRLNPNPAMDGYVKWQLIPYVRDLEGADPRLLERVIAGLPPIVPQPDLTPQEVRYFSAHVKKAGGRPDPRAAEAAVQKYDQLKQQRTIIELANEPNFTYRAAVINMLPTDNGMRLFARLVDLRQRIEAGDRSFVSVMTAFGRDCAQVKDDPKVTAQQRAQIAEIVAQIKQLKVQVLVSLGRDGEGFVDLKRTTMPSGTKTLDTAMTHLTGK